MGSPKEKTTTTTTSPSSTNTASAPAKVPPTASSKTPPEPPPLPTPVFPPEWSSSLQAFYVRGPAAVVPHAFYSPSPVAAAQPVVWGAQQVMPPYGSPIAYASFYPHGGFYAQPPVNVGMSLPTPETEGRPSEPKDKRSATKGTLKDGGGSPGKSGNDITGKGYASARENASQSDDSATEGSSDTEEDDGLIKEHIPAKKRNYGTIVAEGEASHPPSTAQFSVANAESSYCGRVRTVKKLPVSAPGRAALPSPPTNSNIGMDFWGASHAVSVPVKVGTDEINPGLYQQDERELRREKRKQSNRESARRSRLRKQQECEELARKVIDLNSENNALRVELEGLKKKCGELEVENRLIMVELKQTYGTEFLSGLGGSVDASKLQPDGVSS